MQPQDSSILIVCATTLELANFLKEKQLNLLHNALGLFPINPSLNLLITGPGILPMLALCTRQMVLTPPRAVINVGFSGLYPTSAPNLPIGTPTITLHERVHPYGILRNGEVNTISSGGLPEPIDSQEIPATTVKEITTQLGFMTSEGVTVTTPTGKAFPPAILSMQGPCTESMEAAACAYACTLLSIPLITLRIISNRTPDTHPKHWPIQQLQQELAGALYQLLQLVI